MKAVTTVSIHKYAYNVWKVIIWANKNAKNALKTAKDVKIISNACNVFLGIL